MTKHLARAAALTLTLGLALTACSSDDEKNDKHRAEACTAVENLRVQVEEMRATLTADSTVEEWREARDVVKANVEKVEDALEDVSDDSADKVETAWEEFNDQLSAVEEDATVPEAGKTLSEEFQALQDARTEAASGLTCD